MIIFSEVHRGSVTHSEATNDRINSCKSIENCRTYAKYQITFRKALSKINNVIRDKIEITECTRQLQNDGSIPNLGTDEEFVNCIAKETCHSPKQNVFNRLNADATLNNDVVNRFKHCEGNHTFRVSDVDKLMSGPGA